MTTFEERQKEHEERMRRAMQEAELLRRFGFEFELAVTHARLAALTPERRREIAQALIELMRDGHAYVALFTRLIEVDPRAFDPYLGELDGGLMPESYAFHRAPGEAIARFVALLDSTTEVPKRVQLGVGFEGQDYDVNRFQQSSANDAGSALMALARSRAPEAQEAIRRWMAKADAEARADAELTLHAAGYAYSDERGVEPLFVEAAWVMEPAPSADDAELVQWQPREGTCGICGEQLRDVISAAKAPKRVELEALAGAGGAHLPTCARCLPYAWGGYYVKLSKDGARSLMPPVQEGPPPEPRRRPETKNVVLRPAPLRMSYYQAETSALDRVGGEPTWVQAPVPVKCPECQRLMSFVAQVADPYGTPAVLLGFRCERDEVIATLVQRR
jgi:hypothetical protein